MNFISQEHEENYRVLLQKYNYTEDKQYRSNIYLSALPDLFDKIDLSQLDTGFGPLFYFTKWNDDKDEFEVKHPALTSTTKSLVEFGLSLFNGYSIDLDGVISSVTSDELFNSLIEAMAIRAGKVRV